MEVGEDSPGVLRRPGESHEVTFVELFFDLIFVLAVTQLTDLLLGHLTPVGAAQTTLLLLAIWWAWIDTAWLTNWFDPNRASVRLLLVVLALLSLVMSATLPRAYHDLGVWTAGAYVSIQVGRSLFGVVALHRRSDRLWRRGDLPDEPSRAELDRINLRRNWERILAWRFTSGLFWIAGALLPGTARLAVWTVAVTIEYVAAAAGFYLPGLGRSTPSDWQINGRHLAERVQLFVLIALGESILATGTVLGERPVGAVDLAAFVMAFLGSVALWWLYFDRSAGAAQAVIDQVTDPGRLGRSAYTYYHLPMIAGIIVSAVGDERIIDHPTGPAEVTTIVVVLGGPALFLVGHALFKHAMFDVLSWPRLLAIGVLVALVPAGLVLPPLALATAATVVVAAVAAHDTLRVHSGVAGR